MELKIGTLTESDGEHILTLPLCCKSGTAEFRIERCERLFGEMGMLDAWTKLHAALLLLENPLTPSDMDQLDSYFRPVYDRQFAGSDTGSWQDNLPAIKITKELSPLPRFFQDSRQPPHVSISAEAGLTAEGGIEIVADPGKVGDAP